MPALKTSILDFVAEHPTASSREIGTALGCSASYVRFVFCRMKISRKIGPRRHPAGTDTVVLKLTPQMQATLIPAAEKRGITVFDLCKNILKQVGTDGIVDAVLDDEVA